MPTAAGPKTPAAGSSSSIDTPQDNAASNRGKPSAEGIFDAGLVDAINQIFSEFAFAYHNQYHKAFPDNESVAIAKEYWLSCLADFSPTQIATAARKLVKSSEFLPTVSAIVKACERGVDLFGLPAARQAYFEACRAASPKSSHRWSHPAVYYAGKTSDWYVLANEPEAVAFPVFEYNYQLICQRVMAGETLEIEHPKALEREPDKVLTPKERQSRMRELRKELKL